MPGAATRTCSLYVLPAQPSEADLDLGYVTRGADLVACDLARRLAVQTFEAEHELQDRRPPKARPSFRWLMGR